MPVIPLRDRLGADFFKNLPRLPGVYFMYGYGGALIYVGKAKDLRARLSTYPRYATAPAGTVSTKVLRLVQTIEEIRFEVVPSEEDALLRENALLREHRPFFNVINKNPQSYPLLGIRYLENAQGDLFERTAHKGVQEDIQKGGLGDSHRKAPHVELWLTSREQDFGGPQSGEFKWFGSFKSKRMIREGVGAMLRLLWLCETQATRFDFPREIQCVNPRRPYSLPLDPAWRSALESFWAGRSPRFLTLLTERLLAREDIPAHLYHAVQRDLEEVRQMYDRAPRRLRRMCLKLGTAPRRGSTLLAQTEWDDVAVRYLFARKAGLGPDSVTGSVTDSSESPTPPAGRSLNRTFDPSDLQSEALKVPQPDLPGLKTELEPESTPHCSPSSTLNPTHHTTPLSSLRARPPHLK